MPILNATARVPVSDGEEDLFKKFGVSKTVGSWSELQNRGFKADPFGCIVVPYLTGFNYAGVEGHETFLPHEILVSAKGFLTIRIKFEYEGYVQPHNHVPHFEVRLSKAFDNAEAETVEDYRIVIKGPPTKE